MTGIPSESEQNDQVAASRRLLFGLAAAVPAALAVGAAQPAAAADAPAQTWDRIMSTRTLRVGAVVGEEPNFHKDPSTGEWSGFNIDMGRSIAKILDVKLQIIETTWGGSVLDLQANKIDIAFGLQATPARGMVIDFTRPIYSLGLVVVPRNGFAPQTWNDLDKPDVRLAVDAGSVHEAIARRYAPHAKITAFKTRDEAILAIVSGRADANVATSLIGILSNKKNPQLGKIITPTPTLSLSSYFGVRQGDTRLANFLSVWGTYNRELGQVREWIIDNLKLAGLSPDDVPPTVQF